MSRRLKSGGPASLIAGAALCLALLGSGITREVPLGSIHGSVTMAENGRPLPGAEVTLRAEFEQDGAPAFRMFRVRSDGQFTIPSLPAGEYTLSAYTRAHSLGETRIEVTEGKTTSLELALEPGEPYLELSASQHVFTPDEEPSFLIDGFVDEAEARVRIFKATPEQVIQSGGIQGVFDGVQSYMDNVEKGLARFGTPVKDIAHKIATKDAEGVFRDFVELPALPSGIYWVECGVGAKRRGTYLNVTRLSLVAKHSSDQAICYASDIVTGKPAEGVVVGLGQSNAVANPMSTGPDGTARLTLPTSNESSNVLVVASRGADHAFVDFYRYNRTEAGSHRIFSYTDRPVYRPGDEVLFKGIIRKHTGSGYAMPSGGYVDVEVLDGQDDPIQKMKLPVDASGTFHGKFTFNREAPPAAYQLVCGYGDSLERHTVEVAAYRKPEFTVKVAPAQKFYVKGDRASMKVDCEYFFGGPVVGAKVRAYVTRTPFWSYGDGEEAYYSEDGGSGGEFVAEAELVTDGHGEAVIEFDTELAADPELAQCDYLYTVNASVEEGDKYFDGTGSVRVTRGAFALSAEPNAYMVAPGQEFVVKVRTQSHADESPVSGRQVRVRLGRDVWTGDSAEFIEDHSYNVTTGSDGTAEVRLKSDRAGSVTIKAVASDDSGNEIESTGYMWVDGAGAEISGPAPEIKLELDRKQYDVGGTAKLLIQTGKPGGSALVTVEGERVYSSRIVPLDKGATTISLPITKELAPNAFVSIAYVHNKKFMESSQRLAVFAIERKLDVSIESDRDSYKPGDTVAYTIRTTQGGKGVPADVSLGVVDESIYTIREDGTDILGGFYPLRENGVQTSFSFAELYLDGGDKTPADIKVRSKFLDTATWIPNVKTGPDGSATVQVQLPDNLTSWRATAIAASGNTAVGQTTHNVKARKDLMIRLQMPSFLVQQDRQTITATVINDGASEARVHVTLESTLPFSGSRAQTVTVGPGQPATLEWLTQATRTGTASFTAKAWIDGGDSDGVAMRVAVLPHARLQAEQYAGEIRGETNIPITVRPGADPNSGRVLVTLSPSLASTLVRSLDGLIDYPYGCVEQTMSRFLPAILVDQTIRGMGLTLPRAKEVPAIVADGYQRLANLQLSSGAWGWFGNDQGDPYMTAYVLEGIHRAVKAGYGKHRVEVRRALDWAIEALDTPAAKKWPRSDRLYLLYALALHGETSPAAAWLARENLTEATAAELAFACLAAHAMGDQAQAQALRDRILAMGILTPGTLHWPESGMYGYEATGRAMQAIQAVDPNDPSLTKVVRYLMQVWKGEQWMSTRDTAIILGGMSEYLANRHEGAGSGTVEVVVNGAPVQTISLGPKSLFDPAHRVSIPLANLRTGDNTITLRGSTGLTCYYSVDFRQHLVREELGQVLSGNGITVERRYYSLEAQELEDGSTRLMTSAEAIDEIESGRPVRVVLRIRSSKDHEFVMVEDPIPSNCRVMDRGAPDPYDEWSWWYSEMTTYDDKVTFFARRLPRGINTLEYTMRAESGGVCSALPTVLTNMYDPKVRATSAENRLEVRTP